MPTLPSGTVTFLFGDIEHSTRLLQHPGDRYTAGDGFFVVFQRATHGVAEGFEGLAGVAVAQHQLGRAVRLLGAAETLREAIGAPLSPRARVQYDRDVAAVRTGLGAAAFAGVWATGKATPPEQVITHGK